MAPTIEALQSLYTALGGDAATVADMATIPELIKAIAEVYEDKAGTTVTITPAVSEGTKIADYTLDGVEGALYAPSAGGSVDYSTDEQEIGTWTDGSPLYEKTFISTGLATGMIALPNNINFAFCENFQVKGLTGAFEGITWGPFVTWSGYPVYCTFSPSEHLVSFTYTDTESQGGDQQVLEDSTSDRQYIITLRYTKSAT